MQIMVLVTFEIYIHSTVIVIVLQSRFIHRSLSLPRLSHRCCHCFFLRFLTAAARSFVKHSLFIFNLQIKERFIRHNLWAKAKWIVRLLTLAHAAVKRTKDKARWCQTVSVANEVIPSSRKMWIKSEQIVIRPAHTKHLSSTGCVGKTVKPQSKFDNEKWLSASSTPFVNDGDGDDPWCGPSLSPFLCFDYYMPISDVNYAFEIWIKTNAFWCRCCRLRRQFGDSVEPFWQLKTVIVVVNVFLYLLFAFKCVVCVCVHLTVTNLVDLPWISSSEKRNSKFGFGG